MSPVITIESLHREIERLNGQVAEWSRANLAIVAKCVDLERRLAATAEERDTWKDGGETLALEVKDLQREVAELSAALTTRRSACDEESERADWAEQRVRELEGQLAETRRALNRIARGAELQAHVMRDPLRTGDWAGAEKVADAFDDIAERAGAAAS